MSYTKEPPLFLDYANHGDIIREGIVENSRELQGLAFVEAQIDSLMIEENIADKINQTRNVIMVGTALNIRFSAKFCQAKTDEQRDEILATDWYYIDKE